MTIAKPIDYPANRTHRGNNVMLINSILIDNVATNRKYRDKDNECSTNEDDNNASSFLVPVLPYFEFTSRAC